MRKLCAFHVCVLLLLAMTGTGFTQFSFYTQLSANQSVPAVGTPSSGSGTGYFILNENKTELQFRITLCDLTGPITAAHFHNDSFGKAGPVVRTISTAFAGNTAAGVWTSVDSEPLTPALVQALFDGELYINIHTAANGPGELRGQIGKLGFSAELDTAQAVPSPGTPSSGSGTASFSLSPNLQALQFDITVDGLTGPITAAHFHRGAAGQAGPVVKTITADFDGNTAHGVWRATDAEEALTDTLLQDLLNGNLYINIHTAANGPGELRGQVSPVADIHIGARVTVSQSVPPVGTGSSASGTATVILDDALTEVDFRITVTNLTGAITAAHFHMGAPGAAGPVVRTITSEFVGNTATGKWQITDSEPLTPALVDELLKGNLYFNIHTAANGPGELRGQIGDRLFFADLDTAQAVPGLSVASSASGTGVVRLSNAGDEAVFDVTVCDLTGPFTAAHFHNAAAGGAGPVVRTITTEFTGNSAYGVWTASDAEPLTTQLVDELLAGNLYFNVHTAANGPGELRGQVNSPGLITSVERIGASESVPEAFTLSQNFPNPFNPSTEIRFTLREAGRATLRIFNVLGQEVAIVLDENLQAGAYKVNFEASSLTSGIYVYQLEANGLRQTRRMVLLR